MTVKREKAPKRKYAPKEERAKKMGVVNATSQFVSCRAVNGRRYGFIGIRAAYETHSLS